MNPMQITNIGTAPLQSNAMGLFAILIPIVIVLISIVSIAGMWKTFTKAGKPGWGALIPILNIVLIFDIADRPLWWILGMFVPIVNFVVGILVIMSLAENFNKDIGFAIGLILLPFIFWPLLGFGDAKYVGDTSSGI